MKLLKKSEVFFHSAFIGAFAVLFLAGCTTTAAKRAMNKRESMDTFSGFDNPEAKISERKSRQPQVVPSDLDTETAVEALVRRLQSRERAYIVTAEDELMMWAQRPGAGSIVYNKVRLLLKDPRVEVRAPAVRLTIRFGGNENTGDLVELLADEEYLIRRDAFQVLRARHGMDFGFSPAASKVLREKALEDWRGWWQDELMRKDRSPQISPNFVPAPENNRN